MELKKGIIDMYQGTRAIGGIEWMYGLKQVASTCVLSVGSMSSPSLDQTIPVMYADGSMTQYSSKTQTKTDVQTARV